MDTTVFAIFVFVYLGMLLGRIPGFALDRTGIAILGAIALLVSRRISADQAWNAINIPTMLLLLGLMLVSAQLRLGGFYSRLTRRLAAARTSPEILLALLIALAGCLSAVLANDIVCLAVTPILIEGCAKRRLNPVPFLLALACAANIGSAATLIGNPQNMLIGQVLQLSFGRYILDASVPVVLGLGTVWWVVRRQAKDNWHRETTPPEIDIPGFDPWQTGKGLLVLTGLVTTFLLLPWPRDLLALAAGGFLLSSRTISSRRILGMVDWQLLMLFAALFVVNHALASSGVLGAMLQWAHTRGIHVESPCWLFAITVVLSNLVSNVPATMLLLPLATHPLAGPILALSSTLAGNLLLVGSIANLIVVEQAAILNVRIGWLEHARVGIPVTFLTLLCAGGWLWLLTHG